MRHALMYLRCVDIHQVQMYLRCIAICYPPHQATKSLENTTALEVDYCLLSYWRLSYVTIFVTLKLCHCALKARSYLKVSERSVSELSVIVRLE